MSTTNLREEVREKYGSIALGQSEGCCGGEGGCDSSTKGQSESLGYDPARLATLPPGADLGLGCGTPLDAGELSPGQTVVDLGSGGGIDCFLAAQEVGPTGKVIGVDMTPAMVEKARENREKAGNPPVEFRLGEIENLPVADDTVDVLISNCVINLSLDKPRVFQEAFRVLKPGGRIAVSDLVLQAPLPEETKQSIDAYVGCVAGASLQTEYLAAIRAAGFTDVQVESKGSYSPAGESESGCTTPGIESVTSIRVRATKPQT